VSARLPTFLLRRGRRLRGWASVDGRLRLVRPWALVPGLVLLAGAIVFPAAGMIFAAYAYLLLVVAAYWWTRTLGASIALSRRWSGEWLQAGDVVEELWELRNASRLPLLWVQVENAATLPGYTSRWATAAGPGERQQWRASIVCRQRGAFTLGPLRADLGDPFGIFQYTWRDTSTHQLIVYPPLLALPPLDVPRGRRGGLMRAALTQQQTTPSVSGLRAYVPGDPPSHIHWPTVAKTEQLMVKEFDQERAGAIWVVLDFHAPAYATSARAPSAPTAQPREEYQQSSAVAPAAELDLSSPLELAIALGCSIVAQVLAEGRAVGLLADDGRQRLVMPGQGPQQLWRILGALIDARASGLNPLDVVLRQGQAAAGAALGGAALVVITPDNEGAWLPALSRWQRGSSGGILALLVAEQAAHTAALASRLAAIGVPAQTFETGAPPPPLHPTRPRVTQRVSPLGKIIRTPS
jgi:uncharacterized protein (DUF58 family)